MRSMTIKAQLVTGFLAILVLMASGFSDARQTAEGIELIGDYRGAPYHISAKTDAAGRAQVVVRNQGLNIIAAEVDLPVANDADIETRGLFTSLTFLGEAHRE